MIIIIEIKVGMGKKEVIVIIIKKFIMRVRELELDLFKLVARVSYYRVYR